MKHSSGIAAVDEIGKIHFTGNIVPDEWYSTIQKESGKPYHLAIAILSDIVYWYRPLEIRDEKTGRLIRWQKKFKGDMLQKSYSGYEKKFKESKRTIKEAIDFLVRLGAVVREFRDVKTIGDGILRNVMYLSAVPEVIMELTYPEEETTSGHGDQKSDDEQTETHVIYRGVEEDEIRESLADTGVEVSDDDTEGGSYKKTYDVVQKNVPPPTEKRTTSYTEKHHLLQRDVPHGTEIRGTNTENTTETTNGDYNNQIRQSSAAADEATEPTGSITETEAYIRLIKKNLEYDIMRERYTGADRELYETIFRVICHVVCGKGNKKHRIGDLEFPHETVKSVFMKLNQTHIGIVMEGYQDTATKVTDMGAYLTAALYNAYVTGNLYWDRRVKYDMYGGGWEEQGITTTRTEENNG